MDEGDEADYLVELFDACHRVLPHVDDAAEDLARVIRETRRAIERRLFELGIVADSPNGSF